jgi:hypothetical protein
VAREQLLHGLEHLGILNHEEASWNSPFSLNSLFKKAITVYLLSELFYTSVLQEDVTSLMLQKIP